MNQKFEVYYEFSFTETEIVCCSRRISWFHSWGWIPLYALFPGICA